VTSHNAIPAQSYDNITAVPYLARFGLSDVSPALRQSEAISFHFTTLVGSFFWEMQKPAETSRRNSRCVRHRVSFLIKIGGNERRRRRKILVE